MKQAWERIFRCLSECEPADAANRIRESDPEDLAKGAPVARLREAFARLLERRGYFVRTPQELTGSLREILAMGAGFDLFDLARALSPMLPELACFSEVAGWTGNSSS